MASYELIAHTIILKYQHAMPLYKQESYFDMMGVTLSIDKNYYDIRFKIRAKKTSSNYR